MSDLHQDYSELLTRSLAQGGTVNEANDSRDRSATVGTAADVRKPKKNGGSIVPHASATPTQLIEIALHRGADVGVLERLFDLQMKWEANEAKKAFVVDMARFKSEVPQILKNRHVSFPSKSGTTSYDHATIDQVCDVLVPALSKYNFSHRWEVAQESSKIKVSCIITHVQGHSERTTMEAAPDDSGSKNPIQAISSSTTYLERYTFLAATGTAAKGTDTDGVVITLELQACLDAIRQAPDLTGLKKVSTQAIQDYMKAKDLAAARTLIEARDERKKELVKDEPA